MTAIEPSLSWGTKLTFKTGATVAGVTSTTTPSSASSRRRSRARPSPSRTSRSGTNAGTYYKSGTAAGVCPATATDGSFGGWKQGGW